MKKIPLLVLGLTLTGGLAYLLSSTDVLQGSMRMLNQTGDSTKNSINMDAVDSDGDGLVTSAETKLGTDPDLADTDGGGVPDGLEVKKKMDPLDATDDADLTKSTATAGTTSTESYVCSELSLSPAEITVSSASEASAGIDLAIQITLKKDTSVASISKNMEAFTIPPQNNGTSASSWEGSLVVRSSGQGTFTDSKGNTGNPLTIPATSDHTQFTLTYSGGAVGDTLTATIKEESNCKDSVKITLDQSSQSTSLTCDSLDISPDTYTLSTDETEMDFTVTVSGTETTAWADFTKNLLAFTLDPKTGTSTTNTTEGMALVIKTSGKGTLSSAESSKTGTSLTIPITETSTNITINYASPAKGDVLKASIKGQENSCTDTLTLSAEKKTQTSTSTSTSNTSSTQSTTTTTQSTTNSTESSTSTDSLSSNAETIIGSSDYSCDTPFTDIESTAWYMDIVCRMYQANVVDGKTKTQFDAGSFITNAEAIKILVLMAGYTKDDASGLSEDFLDVNDGDWYSPYIKIASDLNIVRTKDAGEYFNPNNPISNGWFMIYSARTFNKTLTGWDESDIPFSDLEVSTPSTYAYIIAYNTWVTTPEEGLTRIVNGYSDNTVQPNAQLKRSIAMALAQRIYLGWAIEQ